MHSLCTTRPAGHSSNQGRVKVVGNDSAIDIRYVVMHLFFADMP